MSVIDDTTDYGRMRNVVRNWKMRTGMILGTIEKQDKDGIAAEVQENEALTGIRLVNVVITVDKGDGTEEDIDLMFLAPDATMFAHQMHDSAHEEVVPDSPDTTLEVV